MDPRAPIEYQKNEKDNVDGHKSGGQNIAVMFDLQLPHMQTMNNPFEPLE